MEGQTVAEHIDAEVKRLADEAMPELLPRLLKVFLASDRPGLVTCERHMKHLFHYVRAQIYLTRAKRNYYRDDPWPQVRYAGCDITPYGRVGPEEAYHQALVTRDNIRNIYRSTPCTCWVKHR